MKVAQEEKGLDFTKSNAELLHEFLVDETDYMGFKGQVDYLVGCCHMNRAKAERETKRGYVRMLILQRLCHEQGHKITVEGHFGPDSGHEHATCKRCGESWRHCYY